MAANPGMTHKPSLDCPCKPEIRQQVGGGRVYVHRQMGLDDGRTTEGTRAPDRLCRGCGQHHLTGHPHLTWMAAISRWWTEASAPLLVDADAETIAAAKFLR